MNADTPITLAAARYSTRDAAVEGFDMVWDAHREGEFDHTAVAVLTKDDSGKLQVERHDTTAKHLTWVGAALAVVAPGVGVVAGAGGGALVGHFHHNIPKKDVEAIGELLESGQSGLIVVAVNKVGTDIEPLLSGADKTVVVHTIWGDLDLAIENGSPRRRRTAARSRCRRTRRPRPWTGGNERRTRIAALRTRLERLLVWRVWERMLEVEFIDRSVALAGKAFVSFFPLVIVVAAFMPEGTPLIARHLRHLPARAPRRRADGNPGSVRDVRRPSTSDRRARTRADDLLRQLVHDGLRTSSERRVRRRRRPTPVSAGGCTDRRRR